MAFRDPRYAAKNYQMRGPKLDHTPRHKFQFWVRFVRSNESASNSDPNSRWPTGVSFKVHTVDRPRYTFKAQTLNQYNKKRVIQTGIEYQPITIKFYDTYDDEVIKFLEDYSKFYYGDFHNESSTAWRHDQTDAIMEMGAGAWGYFNTPASIPDASYYFDKVEIYSFGNGDYTRWDLVKPKITEVSPDAFDYSDGNSPSEITITMMYEGVIWPELHSDVTEEDAEMMGLTEGEAGPVDVSKLTTVDPPESEEPPTAEETDYLTPEIMFRPSQPTPRQTGNIFDTVSSIASIGSNLGLNFGIDNILQTISGVLPANALSNIQNLTSGLSNIAGRIGNLQSTLTNSFSSVSGLMSSFRSGNIGNVISNVSNVASSFGNVFSGFFNDDELSAPERQRLAQPVTQEIYNNYLTVLKEGVGSAAEFRTIFRYNAVPVSIKEALDAIDKQSANKDMIFIGETSIVQLYNNLKSLGQNLSKLHTYVQKIPNRSIKSNAAYETSIGKIQSLGIHDKTLSVIAASEIMKESKKVGFNSTDYSTQKIDPAIYSKINENIGTELQMGVMNPKLMQKPGLNPTQRALQHNLEVVPTYLQQYQDYINAGIAPELAEGGCDENE